MGTRGSFTPAATRVERTQLATDAAGNAAWVFPAPFAAVPRVVFSLGPSADTALVEGRITAISATGVTVNVRRAPAVVLLGISVLQVPQPATGVPVQFVAVAA